MKQYLKIVQEIITNTISKITYVIDIILFFLSLFIESPQLQKSTYFIILIIGFVFSSIEIINRRDNLIKKLEKTNIPVITLYFKKIGSKTVLKIMNLWDKPIKDIRTSKKVFSKLSKFTFNFILDGTNILRPSERRELILADGNNKPHSHPEYLACFNPKYLTVKTKMDFIFKDFNNHKYKAEMVFEKQGIRCKSISTIS
jgi:uncharacterized membrane protein YiaA